MLPSLGPPRLVWRSPAVNVAGPLCRSPCLAGLRPLGLAPLPRSPRTVLVYTAPQGLGLVHVVHPRASPPPLAFLQEGSGGRCSGWDALRLRGSSPADAPRGPRLSIPASPSGCGPPQPPSQGARGPVLFSVVPPSGAFSLSALAPYPLRPLLTARPPLSQGGTGPAVLFRAFLWLVCGASSRLLCACGLSRCPCPLWLFSGAVPRGCSTLISLPLPSPWLVPRDVSILVCSCMCLVRVCLPAGFTCVSGCVHGCASR